MLIPIRCFLSTLLCSIVLFASAQESQTIRFPSGEVIPDENIESFDFNTIPQEYRYENGFYTYLQFNEIPTQGNKEAMEALGIQFPEYLPYNTYLAYIPSTITANDLLSFNARALVPVDTDKKISHTLINQPYGDWAIVGDEILVVIQRHKQVQTSELVSRIEQIGGQVLESRDDVRNIVAQISEDHIDILAQQVEVRWMELIQEPGVPEDTHGRGLHRSNAIDRDTPMGRKWTGDGVNVLCRDDGLVGPHIDFHGRMINMTTDPTGTHGDGVSGIMSGAGNINPFMRGMGAGTFLYVVNYAASFLDGNTLGVIADSSVVITNSSYSNGCNAGYTTSTQTVDNQIHNDTDLLHVFSAGNSNGACSTYGAGSQWGNITGGHKQGKNCMTTANVTETGQLVGSSSRGPAHDGRIKPDISAHGNFQESTAPNNGYLNFSGTSAAAPGIAGISAQLYEVYKVTNGGGNPESALIKATMLNTANDYGNVGPDYKFGYGVVNALRAAMLLEEGRHLDDNISQGNTNTHVINVPASTEQVRFMLYWNDPEASPGANPALVNDLDLVVKDPSNASFQPYVLDETPNATTLDLPATNGKDDLNNMEQVVFNAPTAGDYTIEVTGTGVPVGPQHYFVVYEIIEEAISFTYPLGGESFIPNTTQFIQWDSYNLSNDIVLEYSTTNGITWNTITTLSSSAKLHTWIVPSSTSGECLIRATSGSETAVTPDNFNIAPRVTGINVTEVCPNDITLEWTEIGSAIAYDVFMLGDKYMDSVATTNTNSITFTPPMNPIDGFYYSVRARGITGWTGMRSNAQQHIGGELNCVVTNDVGIVQVSNPLPGVIFDCSNNDFEVSVRMINEGLEDESNINVTYILGNETPVTETYPGTLAVGEEADFTFTQTFQLPGNGEIDFKAYSTINNDQNRFNDTIVFAFESVIPSPNGATLTYFEPFDINGFLPVDYYIGNPDGDRTWEEGTVTGSAGFGTTVAKMHNYNYPNDGTSDVLHIAQIDFNSAVKPKLVFDIAKAQRNTLLSDRLQVLISNDCGVSRTVVYDKENVELATTSFQSGDWEPTSASDWRKDTIDLTPFVGSNVFISFVNTTNFSNNTYLDNILIYESSPVGIGEPEVSFDIRIHPNPASNQAIVLISDIESRSYEIDVVNMVGQRVNETIRTSSSSDISHRIDLSNLQSGLYFIKIRSGEQETWRKLMVNN